MPIKRYKPTTPGRRGASVLKHTKAGIQKPARSLLRSLNGKAGRNNTGRITVRHQGGGAKRKYRVIDFHNPILDSKATVVGIQYDPNRTAAIALIKYSNDSVAYTLAVHELKVGDIIETSREKGLEIKLGNRMALKHIPAGITICNIEIAPGKGSTMVRSAGASATLLSVEDDFVSIKMPSSEVRRFASECLATIGQISNTDSNLVRLGKAGRTRHKGIRPRVRGKAMNPVDHPHGGGEGRAPIGLKQPKTPWGKPARGVITRNKHKSSNTLIVRKRKK